MLELSGIGNPEILSKHDIPCLVDLPGVGENFRMSVSLYVYFESLMLLSEDHVCVPTMKEIDSKYETVDSLLDEGQLSIHEEL